MYLFNTDQVVVSPEFIPSNVRNLFIEQSWNGNMQVQQISSQENINYNALYLSKLRGAENRTIKWKLLDPSDAKMQPVLPVLLSCWTTVIAAFKN